MYRDCFVALPRGAMGLSAHFLIILTYYFLKTNMFYLSVTIGTGHTSVERRQVSEILFELVSHTLQILPHVKII